MNENEEKRKTPYELIGGEPVVRKLVNRFYVLMDQSPDTQSIRAMHPKDLSSSEEKLFMFMSGWLGGPALYLEKIGHPRLRARHLPFSIGKEQRDQWMRCMVQAFEDTQIQEPMRSELLHGLLALADHMRNTPQLDEA